MTDQPGLTKYPHIFQPLTIGPVEVKNRLFMGPHGIPLEAPVPGHEMYRLPAAEAAHYFAERAAAGVGLFFHSQKVGPVAWFSWFSSTPWFPESIPSYARVAEMVHEHGARIMAQVHYTGHGLNFWDALGPAVPSLRPSDEPHYVLPTVGRPMRKDEMRLLTDQYRQTTRHLREAGYDGIEVHVSHGAVYEHFLSPFFNHRSDEYGGSLDNRLRFLLETLAGIREEARDRLAVGIRLTADQMLPGGWTEDDAREILQELAASGLCDFVDIDIAVEPEQPQLMATSYFMPRQHNAERVARLAPFAKPMVVIAVPGQVTELATVEALLARGTADMIGAVRGLIAEPELLKNALEGREERSRHCINVNQCFEAPSGFGFGCALNPAAGREERWGIRKMAPAPRAMKVLVAGAGPAGLEAAYVAALRGHDVTVLESRPDIGGGLALWSRLPGRDRVGAPIQWYRARLAEQGIEVRLGVEAGAREVLAESPEVVIVATGSRYSPIGDTGSRPGQPIRGCERDFVCTVEAILEDGRRPRGRVVVLDEEGLHAAAGVAELLAAAGARVEIVSRKPIPIPAVHHAEHGFVVSRLRTAGVTLSTATEIAEIGDHAVTLIDLATGTQRVVEDVESVVLASVRKPVHALEAALEGKVGYVYVIGDALAPRRLREATYEGHRFARLIGEPDMPRTVTEEMFKPFESIRPAALA